MKVTTLIFNYVCAVCWSPLIEDIDKHTAICARYGLDHAGYHRLTGVTRQRERGAYDKQEVINNYQDLPPYSYMLGLAKQQTTISADQLQRNRRALGRDDSGL
jgi:hypothetical protein